MGYKEEKNEEKLGTHCSKSVKHSEHCTHIPRCTTSQEST